MQTIIIQKKYFITHVIKEDGSLDVQTQPLA